MNNLSKRYQIKCKLPLKLNCLKVYKELEELIDSRLNHLNTLIVVIIGI